VRAPVGLGWHALTMTPGVGIDLVDVRETAEAFVTFGRRYLERIFTPCEIAAAGDGAHLDRLARCFAVKEATIKAIAPGVADAIAWHSIEVRDVASRNPHVVLSGSSAELAARARLCEFSATTSVASGHVLAIVVARRATVGG
jgi:holo-[acyl-carrier protein] synthase